MKRDGWPQLTKDQIDTLRIRYFEAANDAVYVFAVDSGRILDTNKTTEKMLGYSREELLQLTVFDIHPADECCQMEELIKRLKREERIKEFTSMHLKTKRGTLIPVEKSGT